MEEQIKKENNSKSNLVFGIVVAISLTVIIVAYLLRAPTRINDVTIHISSKDTLSSISNNLKKEKVINNPTMLKLFVSIFSLDKHISRGDYLFRKNESFIGVFWQLSTGKHNVSPVKVTLKEGMTNEDMAKVLSGKIQSFRKDLFLSDSRSKQGYLFPDTYFFFPLSTTDEILSDITSNFNKRIAPLENDIDKSGHSISDIIVMASILEKEANGKEDISIISGILWKRIKLGIPLQVDAALSTYKNAGLPSTPISNPGLLAIKAALYPEESSYLFYLHDDNGVVHYAKDFSEHRSNIAHYLK